MSIMSDGELWDRLNRELVAKAIAELQYEQCFRINNDAARWILTLSSGVCYTFTGWETLWGQVRVDVDSLQRDGDLVFSAAQFFLDAQSELELDDIVLANLLEECAQTLQGDIQSWHIKQGVTAAELASMDIDRMQPYLNGHPKAVLNKGRLGWGDAELEQFAPEYANPLQLRWIAVKKHHCRVGSSHELELNAVVRSAMSEDEHTGLLQQLVRVSGLIEPWVLLPVHPWQWQHKIRKHFYEWIARGDLVDLGVVGHRFLPLQSIRTLANIDVPEAFNVKLPVTILNTSCYRGIPGHYIEIGGRLSNWLHERCQMDALLYDRGTEVLKEPVGVSCSHPHYAQIDKAPYRFNEMLGVVWRESVQSKLRSDEQAMLVAGLLQQDNQGDCVVGHLIVTSGLTAQSWMRAFFDVVVVPLYHLMCKYGVGLVAHGQNLTLILADGVPRRLAIKDLQGDLRLVDQDFAELESLDADIKSVLTRLPPHYLIHDLQTGHFVTVLRYLSALLHEQELMTETEFYSVLAEVIYEYQSGCPQLRERFDMFDLLAPRMKRVCINRVRFLEGYGDRHERPLPILGTDLENPLLVTHIERNRRLPDESAAR